MLLKKLFLINIMKNLTSKIIKEAFINNNFENNNSEEIEPIVSEILKHFGLTINNVIDYTNNLYTLNVSADNTYNGKISLQTRNRLVAEIEKIDIVDSVTFDNHLLEIHFI